MPGGLRGLQNRCRLAKRAEVSSILTLSASNLSDERLGTAAAYSDQFGHPVQFYSDTDPVQIGQLSERSDARCSWVNKVSDISQDFGC